MRDDNFWLITVRPTDEGPMIYEKTPLGTAPTGSPTSVTDAAVGRGVMSLPPSTSKDQTYWATRRFTSSRWSIDISPSPALESSDCAKQKGRQDPLGADEEGKVRGKILEEDLGFVLEHVGVYPNIPFNDVLAELNEVDEIIRTGRDPNSLIRKRHDFVPEMIKQVEDLP